MNLIYLIIAFALLEYIYFSIEVGRARGKYNIKAPAVTGNEIFERYYRVQMNTLELLIAFIPALLIAGVFWPTKLVAALGGVFIIGRAIYFNTYVKEPDSRSLGFGLSILPVIILLILILIGATKAL